MQVIHVILLIIEIYYLSQNTKINSAIICNESYRREKGKRKEPEMKKKSLDSLNKGDSL